MSFEGTVRNGGVVPDSPLPLPDGTRVRIETIESTSSVPPQRREGGWWRGRVHIAPDFDELPEDIARAFGMDEE